ncbi:SAF domain-containing protein [Luteococcus sp.]|uniref:SAF domain-containing protein n=1 Tax=Luteococcus sp. TaxID=1969402 RepID=UPI003736C64F
MALTRAKKTAPIESSAPPITKKQDVTPTLAASRVQMKARRRPTLIAGGIGLILASGLAAAFVVNETQTQNHVVTVRSNIPRGTQIQASDLTTATVGSIAGISSVPSSEVNSLIGKRALIDLKAGALLPSGAVGDAGYPGTGRSILGIPLAPGHVMTGTITPGSKLRLVVTDPQGNAAKDNQAGQIYDAIMVGASNTQLQNAGQVINVEVAAQEAPVIGTMAAANRIVVIKDADQ